MGKKFNWEKLLKWMIVLSLAAIWGQSMMHRELSQIESDAVLAIVNPYTNVEVGDVTSVEYWMLSDTIRKIAHLIEYGFFGAELMLYSSLRRKGLPKGKYFFNLLFLCTGVGLIDETIQVFSHRGSLVLDVWLDTFGGLLGLGLCALVYWLVSKWMGRKKATVGA